MGQLKRRRPAHLLRPDQMLTTLSGLRLHALLQHGGIWLAVPPELGEVLNQCCTGQVYELQPGAPIPATSEHVQLLDEQGLWDACRAIRSNFVTSYAAYHHLKAKGWIPRSGLLYGVDYVVVKKLILLYLYEQQQPQQPGGQQQPGGPDHATPACLQNFLVEERIVRRWVPDATRD
eukprot:XP_001700053.1 predicted protein [Chlamydomonas reinhardtii]